jgi:hypothetical protein
MVDVCQIAMLMRRGATSFTSKFRKSFKIVLAPFGHSGDLHFRGARKLHQPHGTGSTSKYLSSSISINQR